MRALSHGIAIARRARVTAVLLACLAIAPPLLPAEDKKPEPPKVALSFPLGVLPGVSTKVVLRGWRLGDAKEVKVVEGDAQVKVLSQGNAAVPNKLDAKRVGDSQVEIEVAIPADAPFGKIRLAVVGAELTSEPFSLEIGGEYPVLAEKEANDGFSSAQPLALPQTVEGCIHQEQNVDVFAIEGPAGSEIHCELIAAARGSPLDGILTLYDASGNILASCDDVESSADPVIKFKLPRAGKYFLALQDAHDLGSPLHAYRLIVK